MTEEEKRVIEAAKVLLQEYGPVLPSSDRLYSDLYAAVAALPVTLSEKLPGLRPGAVVGVSDKAPAFTVIANDPEMKQLWCRGELNLGNLTLFYREVRWIVSEA